MKLYIYYCNKIATSLSKGVHIKVENVKLGSDSRLYCSLITVKPNDKQSGLVVHKALEAHDFHESDYRSLNLDSIAF